MARTTAAERELERERSRDWLEALDAVIDEEGADYAERLLHLLLRRAAARGMSLPASITTPPVNTLPYPDASSYPGELEIEDRIESLVRWNAMAMVARANRERTGAGGHIASYASAATLLEVGFSWFFRGHDHPEGPDRLYLQGHSSPGIYARAYLEGRLTEAQLDGFRAEISKGGLPSYPHPHLMPRFWETPSVSMGLAPIMAIYQARFDRYLRDRGLTRRLPRTWAIVGDGEMEEPESVGALTVAAREGLGNLKLLVSCNLQRLDGPVRGNASIVAELEGLFRGAGWHVVKVLWGRGWCELLARDLDGRLADAMDRTVNGEWQIIAAEDGPGLRERFFGRDSELARIVAHLSDAELGRLERGGHDRLAVWAAFADAERTTDRPSVILAQTVKGRGLGEAGEARNVAHQAKTLGGRALRAFRDRMRVPVSDADLESIPYVRPPDDSPEVAYMRARREALGGFRPERRVAPPDVQAAPEEIFARFRGGSEREVTTTAWLVRMIARLARDPQMGSRVVPIVPDEARTFGLEALFPQVGIYSPVGQKYESVDAGTLLAYRESKDGQLLEEGITEAGAMSSFIAAGTAHANRAPWMVPFFFFYSMFGFQRIGDLIWAAMDARAHGFLIGATSGRTTLSGEGLQHEDGHSHLLAYAYPSVHAYDAAYGYEVATIVEHGLARMLRGEDLLVYLTVANEPYPMPPMPDGATEGIVRGLYRVHEVEHPQVTLLGGGVLLREALRARELLETEAGVRAEVWSVTSFGELYRDAVHVDRQNRLHPERPGAAPYLRAALGDHPRPVVAVSDWVKALPLSLAPWLPGPIAALGTDGLGRSDTRAALRDFFEVDARHVASAALSLLARGGTITGSTARDAMRRWEVDPDRADPMDR